MEPLEQLAEALLASEGVADLDAWLIDSSQPSVQSRRCAMNPLMGVSPGALAADGT
ncbi:MAG: hypothetical protein ACK6AD_08035 [Cyanobacteriota bacterium]